MSNETKPKSTLVEILEKHERMEAERRKAAWQAELDRRRERKRERQRIGGQLTGARKAIQRSDKIISICKAALQLLRQGEAERGLNKKISRLTNLPYEYVMKVTRAASKE